MADEDHLDALVVLLEEQIQKDEEAFGDVLVHLGHGAGDVHQAEHDGAGGGLGVPAVLAVAQVDLVDPGDALDLAPELVPFLPERLDLPAL